MEFRANTARPVDIEQGADQTIAFPLFGEDGAEVVIDPASTVALLRPDGTTAKGPVPVTLDGPTATLPLLAADAPADRRWHILVNQPLEVEA